MQSGARLAGKAGGAAYVTRTRDPIITNLTYMVHQGYIFQPNTALRCRLDQQNHAMSRLADLPNLVRNGSYVLSHGSRLES